MMMVATTTVLFYFITANTPNFGAILHLDSTGTFIVTLCVGLSNFIWLPIMGSMSDRIGRKPILIVCTILGLLTVYPALFWLSSAPSFYRLLCVQLWLSAIYGSYNGAMVVWLTEIMPEDVRTVGFSLAYSLATAIFGGFTPTITTWFYKWTHNTTTPAIWLCGATAISLIAVLVSSKVERDSK
jgi:MFS transporter, MHS family, citrate/tricarballylate:H+ symporter